MGDHFNGYHTTNEGEVLNNLSKVNIFIGENNSGKSRFLRKIFAQNDYQVVSTHFSFEELNQLSSSYISLLKKQFGDNVNSIEIQTVHGYRDLLILIHSVINRISYLVNNSKSFTKDLYETIDILSNSFTVRRVYIDNNWYKASGSQSNTVELAIKEYVEKLKTIVKDDFSDDYGKLYIPVLRGIRPLYLNKSDSTNFTFEKDDVYHSRTVKDYFHSKSENINYKDLNADNNYKSISTGLDLYEDVRKHLLNNVEHRKLIREFEIFIGDTFFKGASISLIPHHEDDSLWIGINDDEKPIYHLGDGIQALIIMLYPLFKNRGKNMLFFIEEPETHLHPGMQRIFLEALQDPRFSTFQYFITTHSNHFLDITLDMSNISIYTFKKKEQSYYIENVSNADNNVLELIGVRNSSVFLSNCTIWVEGITDRLYIKKYLEVYQREVNDTKYLEDIHYSFVEYGGNNITHWSFLDAEGDEEQRINVERLCSKLFLITDSDGADDENKQWKTERFKLLKKNLGNRYYELKAREIENTLPKHIIKKYIQNREKNNDKLNFEAFDKGEHTKTLLGNYIEDNVKHKKYKYKEKESSGTIGDKMKFCKRTTELIETRDDLTNEAKVLCKKLVKFIESNNK